MYLGRLEPMYIRKATASSISFRPRINQVFWYISPHLLNAMVDGYVTKMGCPPPLGQRKAALQRIPIPPQ